MTCSLVLLALVVSALSSLLAWGDEDAASPSLLDETEELSEHEEKCGPYEDWDFWFSECFVYEASLIPRLEYSTQLSRYLLRPPEGVIVLYPDGSWEEAAVCPPDFVEEAGPENWLFCRDPELHTRIPRMWNPPINGIPYEEVEEILEGHQDALMAIDGVTSVGLGSQYIFVNTDQPELVPAEIEGVPVRTLPPLILELLSHTTPSRLRPLKMWPPRLPTPIQMRAMGFFSSVERSKAMGRGRGWSERQGKAKQLR